MKPGRPRSPDISAAGKNGECRLRRRNGITRWKMARMMHARTGATTPCLTANLHPSFRPLTLLLPLFLFLFPFTFLLSPRWRKKAIDPSFRFLDERKVRQVWKELGGQVRKEALRDEESKKHSRLWDSITTSRVIYIDIQVARVVSLYVSSLFSTPLSLSLSFLPGAFTPCKNESNNYRALCLTRNFHPCRSS